MQAVVRGNVRDVTSITLHITFVFLGKRRVFL